MVTRTLMHKIEHEGDILVRREPSKVESVQNNCVIYSLRLKNGEES